MAMGKMAANTGGVNAYAAVGRDCEATDTEG